MSKWMILMWNHRASFLNRFITEAHYGFEIISRPSIVHKPCSPNLMNTDTVGPLWRIWTLVLIDSHSLTTRRGSGGLTLLYLVFSASFQGRWGCWLVTLNVLVHMNCGALSSSAGQIFHWSWPWFSTFIWSGVKQVFWSENAILLWKSVFAKEKYDLLEIAFHLIFPLNAFVRLSTSDKVNIKKDDSSYCA